MTPMRVLVVEDDYFVGEMVRGLLSEIGCTVIGEASDGHKAVQLARSLQPDVVLMDIQMPGMDGIKAAHQISEYCPTPIVVLTAYETPELLQSASEAGVGAYLIKPPNAREIERAIAIATARFEDLMKLQRLNAELRERNAELDAFAYTVAHDIKGQLAPLHGFAEILKLDYACHLDKNGNWCVEKIIQIGKKMATITDELLLLAQLRSTQVPRKPVEMQAVVTEAIERLSHIVEEKEAVIISPPDDRWPVLLSYGPWVEEVWFNYISNALKHGGTPEAAPRVELGFDESPQPRIGPRKDGASADALIRFWVRDNGPGIPEEQQTRLFMPLTQIQIGAQGQGLGLSIVQRVVEKLGGQAGVESQVGQGSTFWFSLPLT